jgi:hypothetical protein
MARNKATACPLELRDGDWRFFVVMAGKRPAMSTKSGQ